MQIFIINLEKDKERLEFALNQANSCGYNPLIINGINGEG